MRAEEAQTLCDGGSSGLFLCPLVLFYVCLEPPSPPPKLHAKKLVEVKILILACHKLLKCMRQWHHLRPSRTSHQHQRGTTRPGYLQADDEELFFR